jgi:hypothetical protein
MSPGLIAHLRRCRRPAVMIAAGLIAVQAALAGLGMTQAALVLTPNLADVADFAVICHGNGGAGSDHGTAPDPAKIQHPCCASCLAGGAPATLPAQQVVPRLDRCRAVKSPALCPASVLVAPRAVRAGFSQAPPSLA